MNIEAYLKNVPLADCAISVNGEYLEDTIIGYRTSSVSNRKTYSTEINEIEIGKNSGTTYMDKRDESNDMQVTFALLANTKSEYNKKANELAKILHEENMKIIFKDEEDRYFICNCSSFTVQEFDATGSGVFAGAGQFSLRYSDPYAYSVEEFEVEPTLDDGATFNIDYNGDIPAKPIFEVTMQSDNGFVGFVDQNGNVLQFGNVDEVDKEPYEQNETLVTLQDFINAPDDINGTDYNHPDHGVKGSLKVNNWFGKDFLSFGSSGSIIGTSNGGLRTIEIPLDSEGEKGCKNFYTYFHLLFYAGLMGQTGEMTINWVTEDNKVIAGLTWYKTDTTGNTGWYEILCYDPNNPPRYLKELITYNFTCSHIQTQNPWYWDWGHCDLRKEGNKLTCFYYGSYPSFIVPEIENLECSKIQISIKQYSNRSGNQFMTYMGFDEFRFQKMNVEKWNDVPNKFSKDDVFIINTSNGDVTLKGLPQYSIGAIDNSWDEFKLSPGNNQIKCVYSEWVETKPIVKMKYREVYIC